MVLSREYVEHLAASDSGAGLTRGQRQLAEQEILVEVEWRGMRIYGRN